MYRLAREWLNFSDALFAAVSYALNPYHLLIVYWRSAYAELLAAVLLPLLLLCISRLSEPARLWPASTDGGKRPGPEGFREGHDFRGYGKTPDSCTDGKGTSSTRAVSAACSTAASSRWGNAAIGKHFFRNLFSRPTLWLSLILAAAWLTNVPAAVMIYYSTAGLALVVAGIAAGIGAARETTQERRSSSRIWHPVIQILARTALAMLLGAGLAAFYLLPAICEQRWINVSEVLSLGVRPQDNFLFTTMADPDHNRFNLLVSTVALVEIGVLALAICFSHKKKHVGTAAPGATTASGQSRWMLLSAWGAASAVLMLSVSNLFWQHLPKLRFVQLPFRWLLCMNVALAMLLPMAARRWTIRVLASAVLLAAVIVAGYRIQPPWWETAADIREMSEAIASGAGYEGTDEYVPAGDDPYELDKNLPVISDDAGAPVQNQMLLWGPAEKHFTVHSPSPQNLIVRLFNYPAWTVVVNGKPTKTKKTDVTGLIVIPVAAGDNDIHIHFKRTSDRVIGDIVSLISLAILVIVWKRTQPTSNLESANLNPPCSPVYPVVKKVSEGMPHRVLVATSNPGKLRDFTGAAAPYGITIATIPNFSSLPQVVEDGAAFEENARKKAEAYSLAVPGELVLADDSGLEIDALAGAPGVHSARYAADEPHTADCNTDDEANNAKVLRELKSVPQQKRTARFVCVLAVARDGNSLRTFRGIAEGVILDAPRGHNGFGYDPLFYFPQIGKTFAELSAEEKAQYSHRGAAFHAFLDWYRVADAQRL